MRKLSTPASPKRRDALRAKLIRKCREEILRDAAAREKSSKETSEA